MISMDVNHPDIMEFIKIKRDLTQVTGANISIKLNKEFMEAVEKDEDYILRFPCNISTDAFSIKEDFEYNKLENFEYFIEGISPKNSKIGHYKVIKAREYWDEIIKMLSLFSILLYQQS